MSGEDPAQDGSRSLRLHLAALLNDVIAFLRRFMVMSHTQFNTVALWIAHSHAFDAAETTPYLQVTSELKRAGKSRLEEILEMLVREPWYTGRTSVAALVRKIERDRPTLLMDESDAAFKGDRQFAEALRHVLNMGWRKTGKATICDPAGRGYEPKEYSVFCPKAIAGIGRIPDTVADRSITIIIRRRAPNEPVERLRLATAADEARPLREQLQNWAKTAIDDLKLASPDIPEELDDRAAEGWEPLLAIADAAGGDWPERARRAALALSTGENRQGSDDLPTLLLRDIKAIFEKKTSSRVPDKVFTDDLVERLVNMDDRPWGDLKGKPLDDRSLSRLLKPFTIKPGDVRIGREHRKGYKLEQFYDAWSRYCPPPLSSKARQGRQPRQERQVNLAEPSGNGKSVADVSAASGPSETPSTPKSYLADALVAHVARVAPNEGRDVDEGDMDEELAAAFCGVFNRDGHQ